MYVTKQEPHHVGSEIEHGGYGGAGGGGEGGGKCSSLKISFANRYQHSKKKIVDDIKRTYRLKF